MSFWVSPVLLTHREFLLFRRFGRMMRHCLCLLLLLWAFLSEVSSESRADEESQKRKPEVSTMAPNSKFLNPHLDDDTNLQFAIAAFADDTKAPEGTKSKASEILSKLSESWSFNGSSRAPRSFDDWRVIPLLRSLVKGNKRNKPNDFPTYFPL